jgi:hypothetical protein
MTLSFLVISEIGLSGYGPASSPSLALFDDKDFCFWSEALDSFLLFFFLFYLFSEDLVATLYMLEFSFPLLFISELEYLFC